MDSTTLAAEDLRLAANWLTAHPDLPPTYSIHRYDRGVSLSWHVATDAEAEALHSLTANDGWRSDHRYDDGDGNYSRIMSGNLIANERRLQLGVAVDREMAVSA